LLGEEAENNVGRSDLAEALPVLSAPRFSGVATAALNTSDLDPVVTKEETHLFKNGHVNPQIPEDRIQTWLLVFAFLAHGLNLSLETPEVSCHGALYGHALSPRNLRAINVAMIGPLPPARLLMMSVICSPCSIPARKSRTVSSIIRESSIPSMSCVKGNAFA